MKTRFHGARLLLPAGIAVTLAIGLLSAGRTSAGGLMPVGLGLADPFAVLAGTPSIENTGLTVVTGDLGIDPAATVNGFGGPPNGTVVGVIHADDTVAEAAKAALVTAYDDAAGRPVTDTDATIGGRVLVSGVYNAGGATLDLTGTVTLDGQNDPTSVWIFQATSDLVTASSSVVALINGAQACNVFWQVGSSATFGTTTRRISRRRATSMTCSPAAPPKATSVNRRGSTPSVGVLEPPTIVFRIGPGASPRHRAPVSTLRTRHNLRWRSCDGRWAA